MTTFEKDQDFLGLEDFQDLDKRIWSCRRKNIILSLKKISDLKTRFKADANES